MNISIVEVAAWMVVGRWLAEAMGINPIKMREDRRRELEIEAIKAEYRNSKTSLERQQDLIARYPQYLVSGPREPYIREAEVAQRVAQQRERQAWKETPRLALPFVILLGLVVLAIWAAYRFILNQYGSLDLSGITTGHGFEGHPGEVVGLSLVLLLDLYFAYRLFSGWRTRNGFGKLAAILAGLSTLAIGVVFLQGYEGVVDPNTSTKNTSVACLLIASGIVSWVMSHQKRG